MYSLFTLKSPISQTCYLKKIYSQAFDNYFFSRINSLHLNKVSQEKYQIVVTIKMSAIFRTSQLVIKTHVHTCTYMYI